LRRLRKADNMNSTTANPYAGYLGIQDPVEVLSRTPAALATLASRLGPKGLERSLAPGKWVAREIIAHLADCEIAFSFRLRQSLAELHHTIQPFDQDAWAAPYPKLPVDEALVTFTAIRKWNLVLFSSLSKEQFERSVLHPERGEMTFRTVVETMAGHDLNHLRQLEQIASAQGS
jgi:DinB superfamily